MQRIWSVLAVVAVAWLGPRAPSAAEPAAVSFDRDIRPILSDSCYACHGPDSAKRQAGLRLDVRTAALVPLDGGTTAIVPSDPDASEVLARVTSTDPDRVMPPPEAKLGRLTAEQVALLRRWIAEGAAYEPHWAFVAPAGPPLPPATAASGAHPVDRLVAARLADRGLALQPETDRATLVRRATFDVTGLPPTPAEVRAFVADDAPDAYERLLDRLLASPRYGERMAADWMDVARYADSYGFQVDRDRPMWPWRDWVIGAFNRNLPWHDFVTWQLAGDLLPDASDEQILATAFNRLHQQEAEGGSVEEEYRVAYVNDRVTTFGTAFLGLTLECCRCHDHKFDPLSQREYYQLFAFFDDVDEAGLYSFFTPAVPTPKLALVDDAARARRARAEADCELAAAEAARVEAAIARLQIDTRAKGEVRRLSGGNQQKVTIARWIAKGAETLLLFDPSRGIDVRTKRQIYALVRELAAGGAAVLFYTSELSEIPQACDRVLVIFNGRVTALMPAADASEARLMRAAYGLAAEGVA